MTNDQSRRPAAQRQRGGSRVRDEIHIDESTHAYKVACRLY